MSIANLCLSEKTVATMDTGTMNFTIIQKLYLEGNVILYYIHLFLINFWQNKAANVFYSFLLFSSCLTASLLREISLP